MTFKLPLLYDYVLPNRILPNALLREHAMIEFLHSKFAEGFEEDSILEEVSGFGDKTMANKLFNNQLGSFPNSLSGSHLKSPFYSGYMEYVEDAVYSRGKYKKYVYPIRMTPHIDFFIGISEQGGKIDGEYFWKNMSSIALQDVRMGRATMFIDYAQENFIEKITYEALHKALANSRIPKENIVLAFNSFNAQQVYESWFTPEERKLEVRSWPFVITNTSFHYQNNPTHRLCEESFRATRDIIRKNHFLFKVRRPRDHRLALLCKLASDSLLDKGDWSCLTPVDMHSAEGIIRDYQLNVDANKVEAVLKQTPHRLESESSANYDIVSAWTDREYVPYSNSYFYICTETYTHAGHTSLTEKVFKPIANFQPFLFIAYPGALKLLRELGFKTFHPYIDESYDTEPDKYKRIEMIYSEITRLCDMPIEELHNWFWGLEEILVHNHHHLLNIWKDEPLTKELMTYLNGKLT